MQPDPTHQSRPWIWLLSGTGEGPTLARVLLQRGWRLRVSVVTAAAARAYPVADGLSVEVGPVGERARVSALLARDAATGLPPRWVVDATHPFATRVSAALEAACRELAQPLLRLERPLLPLGPARLLADPQALASETLHGRRLLLAIGGRQLAAIVQHTAGALHHARVLPSAGALAQALAAGLAPERIACLRPGPGNGAIEAALCRRWGIEVVLCRRSGGSTEALWRRLAADHGLELLLLDRPAASGGVTALSLEALLDRLGAPAPPGEALDPVLPPPEWQSRVDPSA